MHGNEPLYALEFHDEIAFHDEVHPECPIELQAVVSEPQSDLPFELQAGLYHLVSEAWFIDGLKEPWPDLTVNFHCTADHDGCRLSSDQSHGPLNCKGRTRWWMA